MMPEQATVDMFAEAGTYKFQAKYVGTDTFQASESEVATVTVTAQDHKQDAITTATTLISDKAITAASFSNANNHKAFDNKLSEVLRYISAEDYTTSLAKLHKDLMPKADGKAPDWVTSSSQQYVSEHLKSIESDLIALQS